ncbi:MAG TPA: site-2 protease family protein [Pirellulaceae bacterium]|nr:site-2 protease family protein [Pirellulaceae bacterium]
MPPSLLTSTTSHTLSVRMRPDLEVTTQEYQGRQYWIVKDPLALKYFRFEEQEFALLEMLDGRASLDDMRNQFERRFAPQRINHRQLHQLIGQLHRSGLLLADAPGQGEQLAARDATRQKQVLLGKLSNLLAIRFRGIDPDHWLSRLDRWWGWLFSAPAVALALGLMLAALLLIGAEFDIFCSRLPAFQEFFAAQNWLALAVTLAVTKVLHEFGHGLACKRCGGECHEMGLMLLVFTPCLYCNVTDSWMIPSKWKRAAIGAAGMYVELILASLATILWWYSRPGIVNGICLNVMFVCSVSTILFNANPLMRYDGYYILADLLEIPNLRQKATTLLRRKLGAWFLGLPQPHDPFLPQRHQWLFAVYSVASAAYGWLVLFSIFWFLYRVLEPYGLKIIGQLLVLAMVTMLVVTPLWRLVKVFQVPGRADRVNKPRAAIMFSLSAAAIAALLLVPLPYYVPCSFHVQPRGATSVYVDVPGEIKQIFVAGGVVEEGQPIVELDNVDARSAEQSLISQRDQLAARLDVLRQLVHTDHQAHLDLAAAHEALAALDEQLAQRREQCRKLIVRAPAAGVLLPAVARTPERGKVKLLPTWSGRPLERRNVGAYLEASTTIGQIAQPGAYEAILLIPEQELEFLQPGQQVDLYPASLPGEKQSAPLEHLSQQEMLSAPAALSLKAGGSLATRTDEQGVERAVDVTYLASVSLDDDASRLLAGTTGRAKIHAGYQPLATRLWRSMCRTFRFEM